MSKNEWKFLSYQDCVTRDCKNNILINNIVLSGSAEVVLITLDSILLDMRLQTDIGTTAITDMVTLCTI